MPSINADKPHLWKEDVERSIDFYNDWFVKFAPETFRSQRARTTEVVAAALKATNDLRELTAEALMLNPGILPVLRMASAPPIARDRLIGLAHVTKSLVESMEGKEGEAPRLPRRMARERLLEELSRIADLLSELADRDLFPWLQSGGTPSGEQIDRSALVVADRLCGAASDPIIRNAQEPRQLASLRRWLMRRGYHHAPTGTVSGHAALPPGSFAFRLNIPAGDPAATVNIPVDCAIQPIWAAAGTLPLLVEAKSAGDFTNTNKRRKEEAQKLRQMRERYGADVRFLLLLCGYFGPDYLGYEAAEGFDWVWEHRLADLATALINPAEPLAPPAPTVSEEPQISQTPKVETSRMNLQREIDASRSAAERNRLGQFATPLALATEIVSRAVSHLEPDIRISMIEPACGTGAFFSALKISISTNRIARCCGVEIDARFAAAARELWKTDGFEIHECNFFDFAARREERAQFNLLCSNPPYVRHHHLTAASKRALQGRIVAELGLRTSGLTGLYVYFVLLADALLADGAVAAWLIPSEFLVVNYGVSLREYLRTKVTLLEVFQFNPEEVQFDDALVSSCVVTYRKSAPPPDHEVHFRYGGIYTEAAHERRISIRELSSLPRWQVAPVEPAAIPPFETATLGELFTVRRGIATGANQFFVLTRKQSEALRLPRETLRPVLTSPRQLTTEIIEADEWGMPKIPEPLVLLDCSSPPIELERRFPAAWQYLEKGREEGIANGYLCRSREPWYLQEQRLPAPFLVSYVGRATTKRDAPFRFFLNRSRAVATNGFLCLYPKPALAAALKGHPERETEFLHLLNSIDAKTAEVCIRLNPQNCCVFRFQRCLLGWSWHRKNNSSRFSGKAVPLRNTAA
jgi:adenine-specific DNA-methyltransferase